MSKRFIIIMVLVAVAVGFTSGFYFNDLRGTPVFYKGVINKETGQPKKVDFSEFWNVWDIVQSKYVDKDKVNDKDLVYGAMEGMVKALGDPYTVFMRPKESKDFSEQINGAFSGVGIEIGLRSNILTVIAPIKNSPAEKAGIMAADKIVKINNKSTDGMGTDEAVKLIRGPKGTVVNLTIMRESDNKPKEFTLRRDTIKIPAVDFKILDDGTTAYARMFVFNKNVDSEFEKVAREISKSKAKRIILDLRNNPGGLLDSAVNIAGYFLDSDKIVTIERFGDGKENSFSTSPNGLLKSYPLVVLINKGSASASEILAGALKDNRGVTIVGETSFGKGSVQEVVEMPDKSSVKITIAKWLTPNGVSISEQGIKPDVEVKNTEEDFKANKDPQLDKAKELIKNL